LKSPGLHQDRGFFRLSLLQLGIIAGGGFQVR
jgi:hypothetical protein